MTQREPFTDTTPATRLTLLTSEGCVNTPALRANLEQALREREQAIDFLVIDASTLPSTDVRRGYGTPTILLDDRDLMGRPVPRTGPSYAPT